MVCFVLRAQSLEDFDGFLNAGGFDHDGLEAAFEGGIFFDVLAVLVHRGGTDALELATGEGGLDDIGGIHGAFGGTGSDDGVKFVDEEQDILGLADFFHDGLDALFELSAVLGAGNHQGEVEGDDFLVAEKFGDIALDDFLGEAFDNGGFTYAGFTDENGVVLGAAAQDLDDALDFVFAADDRIEFALASEFGQVATKGFEGGSLDFLLAATCAGRGFLTATGLGGFTAGFFAGFTRGEIGIEFLEDFVAGAFDVDFEALEHAGGDAVAFTQEAEEDVFGSNVAVIERLGFLAREGEDFLDARGVGDVARHFGVGAGTDLFFDFDADGFQVEPHFLEHVDGNALTEFDQAEKKVLGSNVVVVEAIRFLSSQCKHLLGARGEIIHWFSSLLWMGL